MAELGWLPRKIGMSVEMSSWRKVCQDVLICSKANTNISGQCLMGKLKSCLTCSYCPTSANRNRDSIKSRLFLTKEIKQTDNPPPQSYKGVGLEDPGFKCFVATTQRWYKAMPTANNPILQLLSHTIKPTRPFLTTFFFLTNQVKSF